MALDGLVLFDYVLNSFSERHLNRRRCTFHGESHGAGSDDFNGRLTLLAKTIGEAEKGNTTIAEAVEAYEREQMRKVYAKQQILFPNTAKGRLANKPRQHM